MSRLTGSEEQREEFQPEQRAVDLVKVVTAQNESEAGFLQGLLREEGIPSAVRRSAGFDVPEFLAAGPRDILVSPSDRQSATELLAAQPEVEPPSEPAEEPPSGGIDAVVVVALVAAIAWTVAELVL
jgi:Putative prokaryotic signal transducing protein